MASDNVEVATKGRPSLEDTVTAIDPPVDTDRVMKASWKLRLDQVGDGQQGFELMLADEVVFGAAKDSGGYAFLHIFPLKELGVSRYHMKLWPTQSKLFVMDLGSTNGTRLNGRMLDAERAYTLRDGDILALGRLEFFVKVLEEPGDEQSAMHQRLELADALSKMAKAITSQLELDDVLNQALEMAMSITNAREVSVWLYDDLTDELYLEAERGIEDEAIRRMRLPVNDTLVGQVFETGEPLRAQREGEMVKVKTGYLVEALLYVPLIHGSLRYGVMAAAHRDPARVFSPYDEKLLRGIADFAAIALHNARLYQKLQRADRLKGEMIQNISHEFRSPLTYIIGYTELLLEQKDNLTDEQQETVDIIRLQAEKLVWLVKNFVALQPLEDPASIRGASHLAEVLDTVVATTRLQAAEKQIELKIELDRQLPQVMVNPMALLQILDNLLSNAFKFTPKGGKVTIRGRVNDRGKVEVTVADTGIGIPADAHEEIFERFVQHDGSMSRPYGGVGLGLAVCKTLLEACGERIWVVSEPGKGATFHFTLPPA